ncbi:helix-turn-helix domain-containing protein [Streptomyces malaysiensis]|uniref:helix-turn-helix domain-containing protein n=1 Tax=Streptomyces malaysiensis TaxID=92644 RepID=UPI00370FD1A9
MKWLQLARIDHAKQLLERSDATMETIARLSGLGTAANFRTLFTQQCGLPPSAYRGMYARGGDGPAPPEQPTSRGR